MFSLTLILSLLGVLALLRLWVDIVRPVIQTVRHLTCSLRLSNAETIDSTDAGIESVVNAHEGIARLDRAPKISETSPSNRFRACLRIPRFFPRALGRVMGSTILVYAETSLFNPILFKGIASQAATQYGIDRSIVRDLEELATRNGRRWIRRFYLIATTTLLIIITLFPIVLMTPSPGSVASYLHNTTIALTACLGVVYVLGPLASGSIYLWTLITHNAIIARDNPGTPKDPSDDIKRVSRGADLEFTTEGVYARSLLMPPVPNKHATIWTMGDPHSTKPSEVIWGSAKFELHVCFTLTNKTPREVTIFDFHTKLYKVSGIDQPLALVVHRARIELLQANTILPARKAYSLNTNEILLGDLVFETSVFDTLLTTIVFGILCEYRSVEDETTQVHEVRSDKIYLFQHRAGWGRRKCHFVSRDRTGIRLRAAEDPENGDLQDFCRTLERIHSKHINE